MTLSVPTLRASDLELRNPSTGRREVDERSLRTEIIIPYVLFHRLEPPDRFTRRHIQRNKRGCIEVFGWTPQTAVIVSSGIAHRQVDISKLLISRSDRPHIRCSPRPGLARGRPEERRVGKAWCRTG